MPRDLWDTEAVGPLTGVKELVHRSNLLGRDRTVVNWGGGNTSVKESMIDFRGRNIPVLWVKGSGSDLATASVKNFTALRLDDVLAVYEQEDMSDEAMVDYLTHCMVDTKHPRTSIETLLHAFLPYKHVDHTHPDAIISICCAHNGKEIANEIFGNKFVWVPYIRPGFRLSKMIAESVRRHPGAELVLMEKHGLVTWGDTSEQCYQRTISIIQMAEDYISKRMAVVGQRLFGGARCAFLELSDRRSIAYRIMPIIRGAIARPQKMLLHFDDSDDVLRFVNSIDAPILSQIGAACPDHLVHTKRVPLYIKWEPGNGHVEELVQTILPSILAYEEEYRAYFEQNRAPEDVIAQPVPRVILIPGVGMITTGKSKAMAELSAALYHRAIAVMAGASVMGRFESLNEADSFAVEYWPLELYKLTLAPPEGEFSRQVAFVTGGAGGIGSATARKLAERGAHVVLADLNINGAEDVAKSIDKTTEPGRAYPIKVDVTNEESVLDAFKEAILKYGGIDILVNNAGVATSSPFEETTHREWDLNMNVLVTGYFLIAREAYQLMKLQHTGGAMVFVGSKNSIYAGKNAVAYSTAKSAAVHMARCIAAEGGEYGIRVNSVLPDAVLLGSTIWNSSWRDERARAYGIHPEELEEYYRRRSTLQVNVYPDDIAEAISYLASSKSSKTTGCMITVDGGVLAAFTR